MFKSLVIFVLVVLSAVICQDSEENEISRKLPEGTIEVFPDDGSGPPTIIANQDDGEEEEDEEIDGNATIPELYDKAVQFYLDEQWDACIKGFHLLIYKYKSYKNAVINCRRKCRLDYENFKPLFWANVEDLNFYEKKVRETLCILKCSESYRQKMGKASMKRLKRKDEFKLVVNEHYGYLHNCYYKKSYYQEAANALFTYLIYHPDHEVSKSTLRRYFELPGVGPDQVRNLEAEPFVEDFVQGVRDYEMDNYEGAAYSIENSLRKFLEAEERCRAYCEGPFEAGWYPEFTLAIANHFAYTLNCKRQCAMVLSTINGDYQKEFLLEHYNYLQFSYFKMNDLKRACEAVESYLLFRPSDETMLANKDYYLTLPTVTHDYFIPRKEAIHYVKRQEYELHLLLFIGEEFSQLESAGGKNVTIVNNKIQSEGLNQMKFKIEKLATAIVQFGNKKRDVQLISDERKLKGKSRFLFGGLMTNLECRSMMYVAEMATAEGSGYEDLKSPHSKHEVFEGASIGKLAVMTYFGLLKPEFLEFFLRITELTKKKVEKLNDLEKPLFFTYTHLVCRTAKPRPPIDRTDLSHEIHADNCNLLPDGSCLMKNPAYTWRDFTAILYLNSNFIGGDFIFVKTDNLAEIESRISPSCGKMLVFDSGGRNPHGVTAVTSGKRCAIGIWFTYQGKYEEIDRRLANIVLKIVRVNGTEKPDGPLNEAKFEEHEDQLLRKFLLKKNPK